MMKSLVRRTVLIGVLTVAGGGAVGLSTATTASAAPCGYYVTGERGHLHNCASYGQWGVARFYSGRQQCWWLGSGADVDAGYDRNISSAWVGGQQPPPNC